MKSTHVFKLIFVSFLFTALSMNTGFAQCSSSKKSNKHNVHRTSYRTSTTAKHDRDLVGVAANRKELSTLVAAVKAAGLVETLQGKGPYTIFAPTNSAFAALPDGTVETLLKPENKDQLIKVLTYHVVPGRVEANDLSTGKVATAQGSSISVDLNTNAVKINDAVVTSANKRAVNGVIHIIDRVLLPPGM